MKISLIDLVRLTHQGKDPDVLVNFECVASYFNFKDGFSTGCPKHEKDENSEYSCRECWLREFELEDLISELAFTPYRKILPKTWKDIIRQRFIKG